MSLFMENVCGSCGCPHGAQGRICGSVQGLHGGKMWVPLLMQREVASGLFVKYMGSLRPFCGVCGWEGSFLVGSLTILSFVGMQCGWQLKMGCSIWVPWQLLDIAQSHDHLPARGQGTQKAGKHLTRMVSLILKVFQILPVPCSLMQLLGLGGKGRNREVITRQAAGCSSHVIVVVHPFVPGCWYLIPQHGLDLGILTAGMEGVDDHVGAQGEDEENFCGDLTFVLVDEFRSHVSHIILDSNIHHSTTQRH